MIMILAWIIIFWVYVFYMRWWLYTEKEPKAKERVSRIPMLARASAGENAIGVCPDS